MKVALVLEHYDPARGGAETSVRELAIQLGRLGAGVTVVTRDAGRPLSADAAVAVQALPVAGRGRAAAARRFVDAADQFCRGRFDVVHAITPCRAATVYQPRGGTYADAIAGSLAPVRSPVMRALRGWFRRLNARQQFLLAVEREILSQRPPPLVAAVSALVARQVRSRFPRLPERHVRVVFNGVSIEPPGDKERETGRRLRAQAGVPDGAPLALFLAHNFKLKGLESLVRAAALDQRRPAASNWQVAVVGRGRAQPFARLAARLGCRARIHFAGPGEPRPWYAAADVLALPTWYDPCSRVVLEAICCGLPVVTTRQNGAAEAVDAACGVVLDSPGDHAGLGRAIVELSDPRKRAQAGAAAAGRRRQLSMQRHAEELMELYSSISRCGA